MTICGFEVISVERAVAWADSEIFRCGAPIRHANKIAVNPLAGLLGVGTGWVQMTDAAALVVHRATSFDEAVAALPAALRDACPADEPALAAEFWQAYGVVGHSRRFGRVVGAVLDAARDFEAAVPVHSFFAPQVEPGNFVDRASVPIVAALQVAELRRQNPNARGGVVSVAEIGPEGVSAGLPFDRSGRALRHPLMTSGGVAPAGSAAPGPVGQ